MSAHDASSIGAPPPAAGKRFLRRARRWAALQQRKSYQVSTPSSSRTSTPPVDTSFADAKTGAPLINYRMSHHALVERRHQLPPPVRTGQLAVERTPSSAPPYLPLHIPPPPLHSAPLLLSATPYSTDVNDVLRADLLALLIDGTQRALSFHETIVHSPAEGSSSGNDSVESRSLNSSTDEESTQQALGIGFSLDCVALIRIQDTHQAEFVEGGALKVHWIISLFAVNCTAPAPRQWCALKQLPRDKPYGE